jgi:NADH-ubiquinone oxidoreductase chain 2
MLLISNLLLLLVNAITFRREYTILFNRVAIFILLYSGIIGHGCLYVTCLDTGIGIYNGLFHSTAITHSFDLFIYIIAPIILLLTGFYARRILAIEFQNYWLFLFVTFIISTTTVCPLSFSSE